jgi:hypothetical protein
MLAVVACLFPALIIGAVVARFPVRVPAESELRREHSPDARPQVAGDNYEHEWPNLFVTAALTILLGSVQAALLVMAGRTDALFSHRLSDFVSVTFLLTLFVTKIVAFPIYFDRIKRQLGPALLEILSRPGRSYRRRNLGQQVRAFSYEAIAIALVVTTYSIASFDTFMVITNAEMRYSSFWSPATHRRPIAEIQEVRVRQVRRAPNGKVQRVPWIEIRFASGPPLDTFYLIEFEHLDRVIAAIEASPEFKGRVIRDPR